MKQRITYLLRDETKELESDQVEVASKSLDIHDINAAKEHRVTLGFDELPQEVNGTWVPYNQHSFFNSVLI